MTDVTEKGYLEFPLSTTKKKNSIFENSWKLTVVLHEANMNMALCVYIPAIVSFDCQFL